ncbi:MAG: hypothetical protein IPG53_18750 [Ignavibacteriales bacterium]|nr:hypothetical protein [Ignavibacteriales bacterium]
MRHKFAAGVGAWSNTFSFGVTATPGAPVLLAPLDKTTNVGLDSVLVWASNPLQLHTVFNFPANNFEPGTPAVDVSNYTKHINSV